MNKTACLTIIVALYPEACQPGPASALASATRGADGCLIDGSLMSHLEPNVF
jgi:hypothetical protein